MEAMTDQGRAQDAYDRTIGRIDGLPNVRKTKPSTVSSVVPMLGNSQTYVVQTYSVSDPEDRRENGYFGFVQMVDAEGRARIVLPPKVMEAIYRQRDALVTAKRRAIGKARWEGLSPEQRAAKVAHLRESPIERSRRAAQE